MYTQTISQYYQNCTYKTKKSTLKRIQYYQHITFEWLLSYTART